jgi:hypothetical protein
VIVAVLVAVTPPVVAVNVAEVLPEVTVTLAGTLTSVVSELVRVTTMPLAPAGPVSVTVPVELVPPVTEVGDMTRLLMVGELTVSVAV